MVKLTSAMAVRLRSNSVLANSALVCPAFCKCLSNHSSPFCAWLIVAPITSPRECFEVTIMFVGDSADMKIMQPLLLRVRVYGEVVCMARDSHYKHIQKPPPDPI